MPPFDDGYMERREKRIQDSYMLKAISRTGLIFAIPLTLASIVLVPQGSILSLIVASITLSMWILVAFTFTIHRAQSAADLAIQREHDELLAALSQDKPKNKPQLRLTDDGELTDEMVKASAGPDVKSTAAGYDKH
jgi:hypothetical protein